MEDWHWQVVIVIAATYKGALAAVSYNYGGIKTELYTVYRLTFSQSKYFRI